MRPELERPTPDRRRPRRALTGLVAASALSMLAVGTAAPATAVDVPVFDASNCGDMAMPTPPEITAFSFKPKKVDVRKKAKRVNVTVKVNDPDGVRSVLVAFESKKMKKGKRQSFAFANLKRKSGSATSGTWTGKAKVERHVIPGKWKLSGIIAADSKAGVAVIDHKQAKAKGWQHTLRVKSKAELKPPTINKFSVTKRVNSTGKPGKVTITAKAKDNKSGVAVIFVELTRKGGKLKEEVLLKRVKGNARNGTYRGTTTIPRWVGNAKWNARAIITDNVGNLRTYKTKALKKKGRATVNVKSGVDSTAPTMSAFSFTPSTVASTDPNAKVDVTATLADAQAGVATARVKFTHQFGISIATTLKRTSGSAASGVWKGTASPNCFGGFPGDWTVSVEIDDLAGNTRKLSSVQLAGSGFPSVLKST